MSKKVVFCTAMGQEYLNNVDNVPTTVTKDWDSVLVTNVDINTDTYNGWTVMKVKNRPGLSNVKMARYVKLHPHVYFPSYDISLWLDTKFIVKVDLDEFANRYMLRLGCNMTFMDHHKRNCIYEECKTIEEDFKDQPAVVTAVKKQVKQYQSEGFPANFGLFSTGVMLRLHKNENVQKFMELWWKEIRKHSQRDMISLPYIMWKHPELYKSTNANIINFKKTYEMFINRR